MHRKATNGARSCDRPELAVLGFALVGLAVAWWPGAGVVSAAVVSDPALFQGANAIDPSGAQEISDTELAGGATEAGLEARGDFYAIHDWTGFAGWSQVNGATNVVSFTDPLKPDIQFEVNHVSGGLAAAAYGGAHSSANHATSPDSEVFLGYMGPAAFTGTHTIGVTFGTWDGATFNDDRSVESAAFTLNNINGGSPRTRYRVEYFDTSDTLLHQTPWVDQSTHTGDGGGRPNVLFGFSSGTNTPPAQQISRVLITEERRGGGGSGNAMALDDLGFTRQPGLTHAFQQGLDGYTGAEDTYVEKNTNVPGNPIADENFGGSGVMKVFNRSARDAVSLLRFDLSSLAGAGEILSARLLLTTETLHDSLTRNPDNELALHRIASSDGAWVEGTSDGSSETGAATWNHEQQATVDWDGSFAGSGNITMIALGDELDRAQMAGTGGVTAFVLGGDLSFLLDWARDPSQNAGFLITSTIGDDFGINNAFYSSEAATLELRPKLIVEWLPVPEPCTLAIWALLAGLGIGCARRGRKG